MDRRTLLTALFLAGIAPGLPALAQGKDTQEWVEVTVSGGWGRSSTIRIYEDGRIIRTVRPGLSEKGRPKTQRFRATPDHWARVWEVMYWWEDGPTLAGDRSRLLDGPTVFVTDWTPPVVTYGGGYGDPEPRVYRQTEAAEDETVPNVMKLTEKLAEAIGLPFWPEK